MKKEVYSSSQVEFELNGKPVKASVTVSYETDQDFDPIKDMDFDGEDQKKFLRDLERGEVMPLVVYVSVSALGETGSDVLGGCLVNSVKDIDELVETHEMIEQAVIELKNNILHQIELLKPYIGA
jgi:hypothetical protein